MESTKQYQLLRIAKKYYELHMGQLEIAQEEGISKSTVSRMLKKAEDLGYVKVTLEYPMESVEDLEAQIKELFHLKDVFISPAPLNDLQVTMQDTCRALADNLNRYIKDDDIVCVSWGKTLKCLSGYINTLRAKNIQVVQMNGGVSKHTKPTGASKIVDALSKAGDGVGYMFPVPAVVDSKEISDILKTDSQVKKILNLANEASVAIFSMAPLSKKAILYEVEYLNDDDMDAFEQSGAIGDIASRFINAEGEIANQKMNERIIGLELADLRKKEYRIGIAVGVEKVDIILATLKGGYPNVLYTDENTARELLKRAI